MPAIAIEWGRRMRAWFPAHPVRIGLLVLMLDTIADQMAEDARLVERLTQHIQAAQAAAESHEAQPAASLVDTGGQHKET